MDMLGADIALGGDIKNVVRREDLSWPELLLMRDIHGEAAVTNIEVVGEHYLTEFDEMPRLKARYGRKFVRVFGRNPASLPMRAPASTPRFDDIIEVQVRQRRPAAPLQANAAYMESEAERRERVLANQGKGPAGAPPPRQEPEPEEEGKPYGDSPDEEPEEDSVSARRSKAARFAAREAKLQQQGA